MKLSRKTTNSIRFILDEIVPPILRDAKWFMYPAMRIIFKKDARLIMNFKSLSPAMTDDEIAEVYRRIEWYSNQRETDLNPESVDKIVNSILGKTVLDAGCGRGYLAKKLAKRYSVTGVDIVIDPRLRKKFPTIKFKEGKIEKLPFRDSSFDTVVCTHTLEHVKQINPAIQELRRVAKRRLIIVVPKQRSYKYTFDLHLQFFTYPYVLLQAIGGKNSTCEEINGDLYFSEDL